MILSQHVPQLKFMNMRNFSTSDTSLVASTHHGRHAQEDFINQLVSKQCAVERRPAFGEHPLSAKFVHLTQCLGKIDRTAPASDQIGMYRHLFKFQGISIDCCYYKWTLRWPLKHRERQVKVESTADDCDTSDWPCPVCQASSFSTHTGRRRVVVLRHCGRTSHQDDVRKCSNSSENILISRTSQRSRHPIDFSGAVNGRHHVHHHPRPTSHRRSLVAVNLIGLNFSDRWRKYLVHSLMLTRQSITWGPKHTNTARESCHHNQWFSTGTHHTTERRFERNQVINSQPLRRHNANERLFPQFTALTDVGNADEPRRFQAKRSTFVDHGACRFKKVCRTSRRNPQLTHRTFSLSLYRSTSNCSYIQECDGLGDQPAEGVQPTNRRLLPSFSLLAHKGVPSFEVRAKQNYTLWAGLRPVANHNVWATYQRRNR